MTTPAVRIEDHPARDRPGPGGLWRRVRAGAGLIGALAGLATITATPADAIAGSGNGSFETPVVRPHTFQTFAAAQSIGAWTVTSGTVDLTGRGFWQAADDVQTLDLNGAGSGTISLTFSTLPLVKYEISYALAGNPAGAPVVKTGDLLVGGRVVRGFSFDTTGKSFADMGYVRQKATFVATGLSTTVRFASTVPGFYGPVIDDISFKSCLVIICQL